MNLKKSVLIWKKELAALKMQVMLGQDKDSAKVRKLRREIARAKTLIHMSRREELNNA